MKYRPTEGSCASCTKYCGNACDRRSAAERDRELFDAFDILRGLRYFPLQSRGRTTWRAPLKKKIYEKIMIL